MAARQERQITGELQDAVGLDAVNPPAVPVDGGIGLFGLAVALYGLQPGKLLSRWLADDQLRLARYAWEGAAFFLTTIAVVRGVHHLGGIAWNQQVLANSVAVQSSLTIYWAILGLGSMIVGVRRVKRRQWMMGAGLMLLVVAKLLLVDMGS